MNKNIFSELFVSGIPGYVFAVLIPLLFLIFMLNDKKSKYILSFFSWGVFSVLIAFIINEWFMNSPTQLERATSDVAPIVEETLKALPLLLFLRNKTYRGNLIIYCAMAAGIGFSIQETLFYFSNLSTHTGLSDLFPLIIRTLTTCLMHGMSTSVIGFGITITAKINRIRIPMVLGLLALASTIHSLFNILISTRLAIIALSMPAILYLLGLSLLSSGNDTDTQTKSDLV